MPRTPKALETCEICKDVQYSADAQNRGRQRHYKAMREKEEASGGPVLHLPKRDGAPIKAAYKDCALPELKADRPDKALTGE